MQAVVRSCLRTIAGFFICLAGLVLRVWRAGLISLVDISDPSVKFSLKFLRKTPWAREQVEQLYLSTFV